LNFSTVPNKVCPSDSVNILNTFRHTDRHIRFLLCRNFSLIGRGMTFSVLLFPSTIEHDGDDEDDDDNGWNPETSNGHLLQAFLQKPKCQTNMTTFIHSCIHPSILSFLLTSTHYLFLYFRLFHLFRIYLIVTNSSNAVRLLFLKIGIHSFMNIPFRDYTNHSLEKTMKKEILGDYFSLNY